MRAFTVIGGAAAIGLGTMLLWTIEVSSDHFRICEYTGSRYGYRQWRFGSITERRHQVSPLEERLIAMGAGPVRHSWVGGSRLLNVFGAGIGWGCGPDAGIRKFDRDVQLAWLKGKSNAEVKALYGFFLSASREEAQRKADSIRAELGF